MCSVARPVRSGVSRPGRHEVLAGTTQTAHTTSTNNFVVRTYRVFTAPNVVENKRNLSILKTNKNVLQKNSLITSARYAGDQAHVPVQSSVKLDPVPNRNIHIYHNIYYSTHMYYYMYILFYYKSQEKEGMNERPKKTNTLSFLYLQ